MKYRMLAIFPTHLVTYAACYWAAFLLRFEFALPTEYSGLFLESLAVAVVAKCCAALVSREWRRTFAYATLSDMLTVVATMTVSAFVLYLANFVVFQNPSIPRSVILIDWGLSILAAGLLRCAVRVHAEHIRPALSGQEAERTLIYGADRASIAILRATQAGALKYRIVGFVDDDELQKTFIAGRPVYSESRGWKRIARKTGAKRVLVSSSLPGREVRELLRECGEAGLRAHVIPGVGEIVDGRFDLKVRDVEISDLLRREPTRLDLETIRGFVSGHTVLVTGAAGSIGSELCRQILDLGPAELVMVDQSEFGMFALEQEFRDRDIGTTGLHFRIADVVDPLSMHRVMEERTPRMVFHAAAYKHVPLMEENPQQAIINNVLGTKNVVDLADRHGVERFVLISSDKAVRPSSIMGSTKLLAEKYLQAVSARSTTEFITVRFGNVLNSMGSVVPTFRRQLQAGGPITVTHPDMERFFMTIPEAVQLVLQAGAIGRSGDVLILEMGEPVKIVDLAKDMILLSGLRYPEDVDIVFTGMRPGEKLYEELFYEVEEGATRVHDKIFCAQRQAVSWSHMVDTLGELERATTASTPDATSTIQRIVDDFVTVDEQRHTIPIRKAA